MRLKDFPPFFSTSKEIIYRNLQTIDEIFSVKRGARYDSRKIVALVLITITSIPLHQLMG